MTGKIAVLDLGSNSIRTTITEYEETGEFRILERQQAMVRISEGMGTQKVLQASAIKRAMNALNKFKKVYEQYPHLKITAIATAAIRQAQNQQDFLEQFQKLMGFPLKVISGVREAEYDYYGVIGTLPLTNGVIVDTGGASTEIILVQRGLMKERISIPFGAVNITEDYLQGDPVSSASFFRALVKVSDILTNIPWLNQALNFPIIAIGGSNRTLAKIRRNQLHQTALPIHGYHLERLIADQIISELLSQPIAQRQNIKGLAKERAPIIIGGLIPLRLIMQRIDSAQIIFSQSGVREGILFKEIEAQTKQKIHTTDITKMTVDEN